MKVFLKKTIDPSFLKIQYNDLIVIKPSLVKESKETEPNEWESVITSPMLIREVTEYVYKQLKGTGKISICDPSQTDSNFDRIAEKLVLYRLAKELIFKYRTLIDIIDK